MGNVTKAFFYSSKVCKTEPLFQYDYGQILQFVVPYTLPPTYEVHFSNQLHGTAKPQIGNVDGVAIPDEYLETGKTIYAWLFLHTGPNDGETELTAILPVIGKSKTTNTPIKPVQQDVITETIAALNSGVERAEAAADGIEQTVDDALAAAKASGEFDGKDGTNGTDGIDGVTFTPSVSPSGLLSWTNDGGRQNPESVNIKGAPGQNGLDGMDGVDGKDGRDGRDGRDGPPGRNGTDGVSPAVTIASITGGHSVTITDADHPNGQTFNVMDGAPGTGISVHICSSSEYNSTTRVPTVQNPDANTFYLVPAENAISPDMFVEWIFTNNAWELFGSASVKVPVQDVQVNGTSILNNGVANMPIGGDNKLGLLKIRGGSYGIASVSDGSFWINKAANNEIKSGDGDYKPITTHIQHLATFYGLAKVAGSDEKNSSLPAGQYTESAKSAISQMLNAPVAVSGTTPSINALPGIQYVCGEVNTLDITLPASGCVDVVFGSGSTPTVLTITPPTGVTVKWANGFDPTALEANTTYEINIKDGLGVAGAWA